jgi:hypothetical protein
MIARGGELIRAHEAAAMLGMALNTFRRRFCAHDAPALPIVEHRGPKGVRRVLVRREDVEALLEAMTVRPAIPAAAPGAVILQKAQPIMEHRGAKAGLNNEAKNGGQVIIAQMLGVEKVMGFLRSHQDEVAKLLKAKGDDHE